MLKFQNKNLPSYNFSSLLSKDAIFIGLIIAVITLSILYANKKSTSSSSSTFIPIVAPTNWINFNATTTSPMGRANLNYNLQNTGIINWSNSTDFTIEWTQKKNVLGTENGRLFTLSGEIAGQPGGEGDVFLGLSWEGDNNNTNNKLTLRNISAPNEYTFFDLTTYPNLAPYNDVNDKWITVVLQRSNGALGLFINGVLISYQSCSLNFNTIYNDYGGLWLSLGNFGDSVSTNGQYDGLVSNFRISDSALYELQVLNPDRLNIITNTLPLTSTEGTQFLIVPVNPDVVNEVNGDLLVQVNSENIILTIP